MSFAAGTVGSETAGSIVSPSSLNGVVGMKPTIALVSRRGIVPISLTQDSAGPMVRTVRDAAMLLNVMAGSDPADPWSKDADANKKDYVAALSDTALQGKRLGVLRIGSNYNDAVAPLFNQALGVLAAQGRRTGGNCRRTRWSIPVCISARRCCTSSKKTSTPTLPAPPDTVKVIIAGGPYRIQQGPSD